MKVYKEIFKFVFLLKNRNLMFFNLANPMQEIKAFKSKKPSSNEGIFTQ